MQAIGVGKASLVVVIALLLVGAVATGSSAGDYMSVELDARVSWIAAETMVVSVDDGSAVSVDLTEVSQDEYQRLAAGDHVIVSGILEDNRVVATSIESLE
jgi:hypothetical protein